MNGQYLMNKQVSVQYAYKKDGKGERHGDEAERMLAAQARKHNVQPPMQQIPPTFPGAGPGSAAAAMPNGDASRPLSTGPQATDPGMGRGMPVTIPYQNMLPHQSRPIPPPSLATPPPGLPARPPPSQAGYGGPQTFLPPGFNGAGQPPYAPQAAPPPGLGPPGFGPPAGAPGAPPSLPPGFQQPGYGNAR
jgi:splicing factor 3B subunit 4